MSKFSFRPGALKATMGLPIYRSEELWDIPECSLKMRAVPKFPSGMEKEEESEHHLQKAMSSGLAIPIPEVDCMEDHETYNQLYPDGYKPPRRLIRVLPFEMDEVLDYDMDSEDENWLSKQNLDISSLKFEEIMDKLEKNCSQNFALQNRKELLKDDDEISVAIFDYWLSKRLAKQPLPLVPCVRTEANNRLLGGSDNVYSYNHPYLAFRKRTGKMQTRRRRKSNENAYLKMIILQAEFSRVLQILELVKARELAKKDLIHASLQIFEKRYEANDFDGTLIKEVSSNEAVRPAFDPIQPNQNPSSLHEDQPLAYLLQQPKLVNEELSSGRKAKRQPKKRKNKRSLQGVKKSITVDKCSVEEKVESPLSSRQLAFPFHRSPHTTYQAPKEGGGLGNWDCTGPEEGVAEEDGYRFSLATLTHPNPECVGLVQRRIGKRGRYEANDFDGTLLEGVSSNEAVRPAFDPIQPNQNPSSLHEDHPSAYPLQQPKLVNEELSSGRKAKGQPKKRKNKRSLQGVKKSRTVDKCSAEEKVESPLSSRQLAFPFHRSPHTTYQAPKEGGGLGNWDCTGPEEGVAEEDGYRFSLATLTHPNPECVGLVQRRIGKRSRYEANDIDGTLLEGVSSNEAVRPAFDPLQPNQNPSSLHEDHPSAYPLQQPKLVNEELSSGRKAKRQPKKRKNKRSLQGVKKSRTVDKCSAEEKVESPLSSRQLAFPFHRSPHTTYQAPKEGGGLGNWDCTGPEEGVAEEDGYRFSLATLTHPNPECVGLVQRRIGKRGRYKANDFDGTLLEEVSSNEAVRPAFDPIQPNQNPSSLHEDHPSAYPLQQPKLVNEELSSGRKAKGQPKKRKNKRSLLGVKKSRTVDKCSAEEKVESPLSSRQLAFPFHRSPHTTYQAPKEGGGLGNWDCTGPEEGVAGEDEYRFSLATLNHPNPECVGLVQRRIGRGGRYKANDFDGTLLEGVSSNEAVRPPFDPIKLNQNPSSLHEDHPSAYPLQQPNLVNEELSSGRKAERQPKKWKNKRSLQGVTKSRTVYKCSAEEKVESPSSSKQLAFPFHRSPHTTYQAEELSSGRKAERQPKKWKNKRSLQGVTKSRTVDKCSAEEKVESPSSSKQLAFPFHRSPHTTYQAPKKGGGLGNWDWTGPEEGGSGEEKYRFSLATLTHPNPKCVGLVRRRIGRGGRVILDRAGPSVDDFWSSLDFTIFDNANPPTPCTRYFRPKTPPPESVAKVEEDNMEAGILSLTVNSLLDGESVSLEVDLGKLSPVLDLPGCSSHMDSVPLEVDLCEAFHGLDLPRSSSHSDSVPLEVDLCEAFHGLDLPRSSSHSDSVPLEVDLCEAFPGLDLPRSSSHCDSVQLEVDLGKLSPGLNLPRSSSHSDSVPFEIDLGKLSPGLNLPRSSSDSDSVPLEIDLGKLSPGLNLPRSSSHSDSVPFEIDLGKLSPGLNLPRSSSHSDSVPFEIDLGKLSPGLNLPRSSSDSDSVPLEIDLGKLSPGLNLPGSSSHSDSVPLEIDLGKLSTGQNLPRSSSHSDSVPLEIDLGKLSPGLSLPRSSSHSDSVPLEIDLGKLSPGLNLPGSSSHSDSVPLEIDLGKLSPVLNLPRSSSRSDSVPLEIDLGKLSSGLNLPQSSSHYDSVPLEIDLGKLSPGMNLPPSSSHSDSVPLEIDLGKLSSGLNLPGSSSHSQ